MKIQIKGELEEPNGKERAAAVSARRNESEDSLDSLEVESMLKVERFDKVMSHVAALVTEGLKINMTE